MFRRRFYQRSLIFILFFYLYFDNGFTNARLFLFSFFICVSTTVLPTLAYFYSSFLYVFRRRFYQRSLIFILLFYLCFDNGFINARLFLFSFFICVSTTILPTLAYFYSPFLYVFRRRFCQRSLIFILLFYMCFDDGFANARLSLFFFFICVPTTVLPTLAYLYSSFLYVFRRRFCQRLLISILFFYICSDDGSANARLSLSSFFIRILTMILSTLVYLDSLF